MAEKTVDMIAVKEIRLKTGADKIEIENCLAAISHRWFKPIEEQLGMELKASAYTSISGKTYIRLMAWAVPLSIENSYSPSQGLVHSLCDALFGYHDFAAAFTPEQIRDMRDHFTRAVTIKLVAYHTGKMQNAYATLRPALALPTPV
jgi:hypothetical protein